MREGIIVTNKPTILIVDDEADIRDYFKNYLAPHIECAISIAANS